MGILALKLYTDFNAQITSMVPAADIVGAGIRVIQYHINKAIIELSYDGVAGNQELNPKKIELIKKSLATGMRTLERKDLIVGTIWNGALRKPDWSETEIRNTPTNAGGITPETAPSDSYALLAPIPNEALHITGRIVDTQRNSEQIRAMIIAREKSVEEYMRDINLVMKRPGKDEVWVVHQRALTVAGENRPSVDYSLPLTNTGTTTLDGIKGKNYLGESLTFTESVDQIITGYGYVPVFYQVMYYKKPTPIVIDLRDPSLAVNSDMDYSLKDDIIDRAVRSFIATRPELQQGYQISEAETKK